MAGDYIASGGRLDDYLELHLEHGRFKGQATSRHNQHPGAVSIRRCLGGRGLAILRFTPSKSLPPDAGQWLGDLVELLEPVLPQLQLDPEADAANQTSSPLTAQHEPTELAVPTDPPLDPAALSEDRLGQAAAALERGAFKEAERLGRLELAAGGAEASDFLESVHAIRRGSKLVRRWPRDAQIRLALGQAYFLADAGAAAVREAAEALRLDPSLGEAHAVLGLEYVYRGERERASAAWDRARTLAPGGEWQQMLARNLHDESVESRSGGLLPLKKKAARGWQLLKDGLAPLTSRLRRHPEEGD